MTDLELFLRAFSQGYILATESPEEAKEYEKGLPDSTYGKSFKKGLEIGRAHLLNKKKNRGKDQGLGM